MLFNDLFIVYLITDVKFQCGLLCIMWFCACMKLLTMGLLRKDCFLSSSASFFNVIFFSIIIY